ncbi:MAG: DUF1080 domain-containing protein, partial [Bacteroidota bacterium]
IPLGLLMVILQAGCSNQTTTSEVIAEQWISLFNGTDLTGWTPKFAGSNVGENYLKTFIVQDSMIRISYDHYTNFEDRYGHLYYHLPYSHYKLRFEYRFVGEQIPGGAIWNVRNSGVMLHTQSAESNELEQDFPVSIELQLLGGLSNGEARTTGNVCTPGTAVMMGDTVNYQHCINSNSATYHGDRWVKAEAIVLGSQSMSFLIEGDTVLQFTQPQIGGGFISQEFAGMDFDTFGVKRDKEMWLAREGELLSTGYIALQAESHPIDFRRIELLDL